MKKIKNLVSPLKWSDILLALPIFVILAVGLGFLIAISFNAVFEFAKTRL